MAVRFDASTEFYTRTLGLGVVPDWTVTCWVKMAVNRAATTVLWAIDDNSGGSNRLRVNAWDGSALTYQTDSGGWFGLIGHSLAVGEWTYIGLSATANPGLARVRVRTAGSTTWVSGTVGQANVTFNASRLVVGGSGSSVEWFNGSMAAVKVWSAALTEDELEQESWTYLPGRTTNLRAWYPLLSPSTVDSSGNGETLSGGTGTSIDDGPPISWRTARHRRAIITPVTGISGSLAATLPSLTGDLTGNTAAAGGLTATLPSLTGNLTGTAKASGGLTATLPSLTGNLTGNVSISALSAALPALTGNLAGAIRASSTLAATLPSLTGALLGEVEIPPDDITVTSPGPVRGWAAGSPAGDWDSSRPPRGWAAGSPTT